jgi:ubiquinone/menaquinone biosynthesis C-methylase UbiE/pimeloyl-ACP methyl ester carboxylesterase
LPVERREQIFIRGPFGRLRDRLFVAGGAFEIATRAASRKLGWQEGDAPSIPLVDYFTDDGERIRAIIDSWGDMRGAPAVVIPPAFGKTKETLLPLAATIIASFRRAGQPVIVVRFDGIRRRGESHNDPECLQAGREYLHYTGSQAVKDVRSTIDFLAAEYGVDRAVLVTFSAASSEGRKAAATDTGGRICGWISVVGAPDAQSAMKKISGGIDYTRGLQQGVRFGKQEILGTLMDADRAGLDAIENRMATYDDAQRDMEAITAPVTWVHGRYDAWMDGDRVRHLLSCGDPSNRRFIEVPTGHQLRTSSEAFDIFRLIANEAAKMALGHEIETALPSLGALARRHRAERARLPKPDVDVRALWADYLLGRDRTLGIELMTKSTTYQAFFKEELAALGLKGGETILDLGSGTGSLAEALAVGDGPRGCTVYEMDFVRDALVRARSQASDSHTLQRYPVCADADADWLALRDQSVDCAFLSLFISYVQDPERVLREVARVLKPGGRLVVSTLRRDADISKIYEDGVAEFSPMRIREAFGEAVASSNPEELARNFLNDGARILSLEEQGRFRFWDRGELADLVKACGFGKVGATHHLGDPPQALIVSARRS